MATIRERCLPAGWYPSRSEDVSATLESWDLEEPKAGGRGVSCVVPHAGWGYSGALAFSTIHRLAKDRTVVVVVGGHLPPNGKPLIATEDGFATPLGILPASQEIRVALRRMFTFADDVVADNTVEVQLPIVQHLFPDARVVSIRLPPSLVALEIGKGLAQIARETGEKLAIIGSTDLTHYGPAYRFSPAGIGKNAMEWVRSKNDAEFLGHLLQLDAGKAVDHAVAHRSACSAGAAAAAIEFAREVGVSEGRLVGHTLSGDIEPSDSFVGYGGVVYEQKT